MLRTAKRTLGLAIAALVLALTVVPRPAVAQSFSPVAVVNDQIITGYDVDQRVLLLRSASAGPGTVSREAALDALVEDTLRLQAARRAGIDPSAEEIDAGFAELARLSRREPSEVRTFFRSQGVSDEALALQIKAEVAWRQLILQRYGARARVSDSDIAEAGGTTSAGPAEPEYLIAEMRFPVSAGGEAAATTRARQVIGRLSQGERFTVVAREVSAGPTASAGGDLGWIARSALSPAAADAVSRMSVDRVSEPFVDGDDVVLLGLRQIRDDGAAAERYRLAQIVVAVAKNAPQSQADIALARATQVRSQLRSCTDVDALKGQYAPISGDIGYLAVADMPASVRTAVAGLQVGQITQPVRSNDGFHVFVVCDKQAAAPSAAPQQNVASELRAKRLERYSRSLLRELRREAVIDRR